MENPFPAELLQQLAGLPGFDREAMENCHAFPDAPVSIRFNPGKPVPVEDRAFDLESAIPWSSQGHYLSSRPSFTFDPHFHAGAYYVQEASSMFVEQALRQLADLSVNCRVLDACAAPGGKSTLMQSLLSPGSMLVSNEIIRSRVNVLEENMVKWGGPNVVITHSDPRDLGRLSSFFDIILVDAPCSGSGLFRRDPEAVSQWSRDAVVLCSQRQHRILADLLPALRPGGLLIYSTCSYSVEEDEQVADWLVGEMNMESLPLSVPGEWGIEETRSPQASGYGYRFWPYRLKGEGFFLAALRKTDAGISAGGKTGRLALSAASKQEEAMARTWISDDAEIRIFRQGDMLFGLPPSLADGVNALMLNKIFIRRAGVLLGKPSSSGLIPDHALALSQWANPRIVGVPLNREQAIQYLRKEEVTVEADQGWNLVQYGGLNLGWIKKLPQRSNNYYPKEWRILKRDN